jgi:Holliday junction resolvase RusA-like endonuclease
VTSCTVVIPGRVETNHRPRVGARGTYLPPKYTAYKSLAGLCALASRPRGWPLDARYSVRLTLHEPDKRSRDLDNACKGALDGARGALWTDDRQIDALSITRGEVRRDAPCVVMAVEVLT